MHTLDTNVTYDYGFSFADDAILKERTESSLIYKQKLEDVLNTINPLLESLKENPEKVYLKWDNRVEVITQITNKIKTITEA